MGLTVNWARQMAKKTTVNRQKRNIFTVNRQMREPKLVVFFSFFNIFQTIVFNFFEQFFFKYEQNYIVLFKLTANFVLKFV